MPRVKAPPPELLNERREEGRPRVKAPPPWIQEAQTVIPTGPVIMAQSQQDTARPISLEPARIDLRDPAEWEVTAGRTWCCQPRLMDQPGRFRIRGGGSEIDPADSPWALVQPACLRDGRTLTPPGTTGALPCDPSHASGWCTEAQMQHREVLVKERLACVGCRAQPFGTPCRWVACGRCGEESTSRCGRCCPWQVGVLKGNKMLRATEYKCGKKVGLGKGDLHPWGTSRTTQRGRPRRRLTRRKRRRMPASSMAAHGVCRMRR